MAITRLREAIGDLNPVTVKVFNGSTRPRFLSSTSKTNCLRKSAPITSLSTAAMTK